MVRPGYGTGRKPQECGVVALAVASGGGGAIIVGNGAAAGRGGGGDGTAADARRALVQDVVIAGCHRLVVFVVVVIVVVAGPKPGPASPCRHVRGQRSGQDAARAENHRNAAALLLLRHLVEEAPLSLVMERWRDGGQGLRSCGQRLTCSGPGRGLRLPPPPGHRRRHRRCHRRCWAARVQQRS